MEIPKLGKDKTLSLPATERDVRLECLRLASLLEKNTSDALQAARTYSEWVING